MFSNYFDVLMLKIILKKSKNIINMYFDTKSYLKNNYNHYHAAKQARNPPLLSLTSTATAEPVVFLSLFKKTSGGRGPGKKELNSFEVILVPVGFLVTKKIT